MSIYVMSLETNRENKGVLSVIKRWLKLRLQPVEIVKRKILIQILNAIWMAHNREQKSGIAITWIAAEAHPPILAPSRYMDMAKRLISGHFALVKSFGIEIKYLENEDLYILFRSKTARSSERVTLIGVEVVLHPDSNAKEARRMMFAETKLLPKGQRRKSWKRKPKKK